MSKFVTELLGVAEIVAGVALGVASGFTATPLAGMLIAAGVGWVISGLGTLLSAGPMSGFATTVRNPVAPWEYIYGNVRQGGAILYENSWPAPGGGGGGDDVMVDLVIVLAAHPCESIDALLFDQQRVQIDTTAKFPSAPASAGTSFTPVQQTINITEIKRVNNVVTVTLPANIPYLIEGDPIKIQNVTGDLTLNGTFQVAQILSQVAGSPGSITFTFLSGGTASDVLGAGQVVTQWADYGRTVYFEPLLGTQALGETFHGMIFGTPLDGDMGDFVLPSHTGGVEGEDQPNPWTEYCSLQGKTAVFLRLHFSSKYYPATIPQISFLMRGKNNISDPRTSPSTVGYTTNAALCIADFLADTQLGFSCVYGTDIPLSYLIAAANVCDEPVNLAIGGSPPQTESAYTCNGKFPASMGRGEVLKNMLTACAGKLTTYGGQFIIWPGAWLGNSFAIGSNPGGGVIPLGDFNSIAAGPIKWKGASIRDLYNGVKGTYVAQPNKWVSGDFPPYCQDALHGYSGPSLYEGDVNLAVDGGARRWLDIQLPFTTSASMAQRIAKIELLRRRWSGAGPRWNGTLVLNMSAYRIVETDLILATIPVLGWTAKQLEVLETRLRIEESEDGPTPVYEVDVQEIDSTAYDWSTSEELSPQGYQQPAIPGAGAYQFFATENVPGFNIPFPWKPAGVEPLPGDALYPGPLVGSPTQDYASGSFEMAVDYGNAADDTGTLNVDIIGTVPPSQLSNIAPPQIVSATAGTSGHLPAGTYYVAASAVDGSTPPANTQLSVAFKVTIPVSSPVVNNGSIAVVLAWPAGAVSVEIYVALGNPAAGYSYQASLSGGTTTLAITNFNQSTTGAPDGTFDHLAVAWKKVIHGGVWAQQVQAVTPTTITIAGSGMAANRWAGYVLSLLGKLASSEPLIILNMPVASNTASSGSPSEFVLTIGVNSTGQQLPDLTTLLSIGDLVVMRFNATFAAMSFTDPNIANPYYPLGAASGSPPVPIIEAGHVALVLTGADAGDAVPIASVALDGFGNYTVIELANPWTIQPAAGDIVIVVEAAWGPEFHTHPLPASNRNALSGVVAAPAVPNLPNQTWLFIVWTQTAADLNGADSYAPVRELYAFGGAGLNSGYFVLAIVSNTVSIDLVNGLNQKLILSQATQVTIENPTVSGNAPHSGQVLALYVLQDATGYRPTPLWGSAFGQDVATRVLAGDANTRSAYGMTYHDDGLWHLDSFLTGEPLS